jgi:hypothetical protein
MASAERFRFQVDVMSFDRVSKDLSRPLGVQLTARNTA